MTYEQALASLKEEMNSSNTDSDFVDFYILYLSVIIEEKIEKENSVNE
jgi:hypothetical protein